MSFALEHLWRHIILCGAFCDAFLIILYTYGIMKISQFNLTLLSYPNTAWLNISMYNIVLMQILYSNHQLSNIKKRCIMGNIMPN